jgi:hypothetical protein
MNKGPPQKSNIYLRRVGQEFAVGRELKSYNEVSATNRIFREFLESRFYLRPHVVIRHWVPSLNEGNDSGFWCSKGNFSLDRSIQIGGTKQKMLAQKDNSDHDDSGRN